jgi:hypothetical protein
MVSLRAATPLARWPKVISLSHILSFFLSRSLFLSLRGNVLLE